MKQQQREAAAAPAHGFGRRMLALALVAALVQGLWALLPAWDTLGQTVRVYFGL